jgi:hypothetical protein
MCSRVIQEYHPISLDLLHYLCIPNVGCLFKNMLIPICKIASKIVNIPLKCTDWDVFFSPDDNLDQTVPVISDCIGFCEDTIIPKKLMKSFPNIKPWITKELRKTINQDNSDWTQTTDT